MIMADVINTVLKHTSCVLAATCKCRFRLRLLAAAPAIMPLALYLIHDLVIPPECSYGITGPEVLTQSR